MSTGPILSINNKTILQFLSNETLELSYVMRRCLASLHLIFYHLSIIFIILSNIYI